MTFHDFWKIGPSHSTDRLISHCGLVHSGLVHNPGKSTEPTQPINPTARRRAKGPWLSAPTRDAASPDFVQTSSIAPSGRRPLEMSSQEILWLIDSLPWKMWLFFCSKSSMDFINEPFSIAMLNYRKVPWMNTGPWWLQGTKNGPGKIWRQQTLRGWHVVVRKSHFEAAGLYTSEVWYDPKKVNRDHWSIGVPSVHDQTDALASLK